MAEQIRQWLESLTLGQHADAFIENGVDMALLHELTNDDLKDLGVGRLADRKRLIKAIAGLAAGTDTSGTAETLKIAEPRAASPHEADRRQLTVLFCDMVGSTELSQKLDPEDMRDAIRSYQDVVAGAINRYQGHVAKFLGDGVLAYFGWPQAYEDQAERAVHAALEAVLAVSGLQTEAGHLAARAGIATGDVVVGDMAGEAGAIAGETPNLAARLQGVAEPHQVVIGDNTRQLIGQVFALSDLGPQPLKGFQNQVPAWRVRREKKQTESRFEAAHGGILTRFVGRVHELGLLNDRWQLAKDGDGQIVLVSGEAGIGKSRIIEALKQQIGQAAYVRLQYQCSPYHSNSAFFPFVQQLEHAAAITTDDAATDKLNKLEKLLTTEPEGENDLPMALIAHLLGISYEERYGPLDLAPPEIMRRSLRVLCDQLLALARRQPVLVLFEDVHWIDPTSLAALELFVSEVAGANIMMVLTHRPHWQSPFTPQPHITPLQLSRLGRSQGADIVRMIAGQYVDDEVVARIVERTDGIPLFVEEVTKALVESGLDMSVADIPATLQASLLARLDRLESDARVLAQIGAVIGREFAYGLLAAVSGWEKETLLSALAQLIRSELLQVRGTAPDSIYLFKHALIRDAAYESMLRETRQNWHARAARALKQNSGGENDKQIEAIASHFEHARQPIEAAEHWFLAARQAVARAANPEAIHFSDRALGQLSLMVELEDIRRQRLAVLTQKLAPAISIFGYASAEVNELSAETLKLCHEFDDNDTLFRILYFRWVVLHGASRNQPALNQAKEYLARAEQCDEEIPLLIGHRLFGTSLAMVGNCCEAWPHLMRANDSYVAARHAGARFEIGTDPLISSLAYSAIAAWLMGRYDTARQMVKRLSDHAGDMDHAPSLIYADGHLNMIWLLIGFPADFEERILSAQLTRLAETPNALFKAYADIIVALFDFENGRSDLKAVETRIDIMSRLQTRMFTTTIRTRMAARFLDAGDVTAAENQVARAQRDIDDGYDLFWQSEVARLGGECQLAGVRADFTAAGDQLRSALDFARDRKMAALYLRAAMSYAHLCARQGRSAEGRDLLAVALSGIDEGDNDVDVIAARNLLGDIAATASP